MDFSDLNDVEDEDTDLIVDYVYWTASRFSKVRTPHYACLDCPIRRGRANQGRNCCSKDTGNNYYTNDKTKWERHLQQHQQRGEIFPQDFFELELPVE